MNSKTMKEELSQNSQKEIAISNSNQLNLTSLLQNPRLHLLQKNEKNFHLPLWQSDRGRPPRLRPLLWWWRRRWWWWQWLSLHHCHRWHWSASWRCWSSPAAVTASAISADCCHWQRRSWHWSCSSAWVRCPTAAAVSSCCCCSLAWLLQRKWC